MQAKQLVSGTCSGGTREFLQVTAQPADEGMLPQCFSWQLWADQQGQFLAQGSEQRVGPPPYYAVERAR